MSRYITLDVNSKVIAIRYGSEMVKGEIESALGELGQVKQADGTFITPIVSSVPEPTIEDKINYIYYKSKGVI